MGHHLFGGDVRIKEGHKAVASCVGIDQGTHAEAAADAHLHTAESESEETLLAHDRGVEPVTVVIVVEEESALELVLGTCTY